RSRWDRVFEWDTDHPDEAGRYFRWYIGAVTNLAHNCVDHHVRRGHGGPAALLREDERGGGTAVPPAPRPAGGGRTAAGPRRLPFEDSASVAATASASTCPRAPRRSSSCWRASASVPSI